MNMPTVAKGITATLTVASFLSSPLVSLADEGGPASFQEQLKGVAAKQVEDQKARIEKAEQDLMSKELLYPDGRLVGRGIIKLNPEGTSNQLKAFQTSFPYGYPDGPALDPAFEDEQSTMFILAVGRDGPPLAAKRIKIKDMDFPIAFELTCDDLVFPYTPDAWLASPNSHDTIALTVILTPGNVLAAPNAAGRVGFGLSEPAKVAGAFSRTTADISLAAKLDGKLYTNEEIVSLFFIVHILWLFHYTSSLSFSLFSSHVSLLLFFRVHRRPFFPRLTMNWIAYLPHQSRNLLQKATTSRNDKRRLIPTSLQYYV